MKKKSISERLNNFITKNKLFPDQKIENEMSNFKISLKFCRQDSKTSAIKASHPLIRHRKSKDHSANERLSRKNSYRCRIPAFEPASPEHRQIKRGGSLKVILSSCDNLKLANGQLKNQCSGEFKLVTNQLKRCKRSFGAK